MGFFEWAVLALLVLILLSPANASRALMRVEDYSRECKDTLQMFTHPRNVAGRSASIDEILGELKDAKGYLKRIEKETGRVADHFDPPLDDDPRPLHMR